MVTTSLTDEPNIQDNNIRPIDQINMLVALLQNDDVSEDIYIEANDHYVYVTVYNFKWIMIYIVLFTTLYLVIFTLLFIRDTVVKPILDITDLITKPEKCTINFTQSFINRVKIIEMKKKRKKNKL